MDDIVRRGVAAGATTFKSPMVSGFMYGHSFQDPDGHVREWVWMAPGAPEQG